MTDGDLIEVPDLPSLMRFSALRETGLHRTLAEVETEYIRNVLASVDGNKTRAAEILGIDRKTLREKLKLYGTDLT
jgi:DNA-binding NtrC family response regulator